MLDPVRQQFGVTLFIPQPKIDDESNCTLPPVPPHPTPAPCSSRIACRRRLGLGERLLSPASHLSARRLTVAQLTSILAERSAATNNLAVTSHAIGGCLVIPSLNSHRTGGPGRARSAGWKAPREPKKSSSTEVPRSLGEPGRRSINYKAWMAARAPGSYI